MPLVEEYL